MVVVVVVAAAAVVVVVVVVVSVNNYIVGGSSEYGKGPSLSVQEGRTVLKSNYQLTFMFLNVSCSTIRLSSGIFKTSRKLEYSVWKLSSMLARFITRYWAIQGQYSSVTMSRSSSHCKQQNTSTNRTNILIKGDRLKCVE